MGVFFMETMIGQVAEVILVLGVAVFGLLGLFVPRRAPAPLAAYDAAEDRLYFEFEAVVNDEGEIVLNRIR